MSDFPTVLTVAEDGTTTIMAKHLNNLEAKVGTDGSAVATSLDYKVKNISSVDPGHKHSKVISTLPVYTDNASALSGGLVAGDLYRTSTGVLMVTYSA